MTKKVYLFAVFLIALTGIASATPMCQGGASLASYVALNTGQVPGCTFGDKLFNILNVTITASGGATAPPLSGITVDTVGPAGSGANIILPDYGLAFLGNFYAGPGALLDINITGTTQVIGGGPMQIKDAGVAQISGVSGTGSVTVVERGCSPLPDCIPGDWGVFTFNSSSGVKTASNVIFAPTGGVKWAKDIGLAGGANGIAADSETINTFSQTMVPEPITLTLAGFGLLGIAAVSRRRQA